MNRATPLLCASCCEFPLEQAIAGVAECRPREQPATWNDTACVLYERARNREQRKVLVIRLMQEAAVTN